MLREGDIWAQDVLAATEESLLLGPPSPRNKETLLLLPRICAHQYEALHVTICVYITVNMFMLVSPALLHRHVDHSRLLPLLICNFSLRQWEIWFLPSAIYFLIVRFQCTRLVASQSLAHTCPHRKQLLELEYRVYVHLRAVLLPSVLLTLLFSKFLPPTPFPSVRSCHPCLIYLDYSVTICILS